MPSELAGRCGSELPSLLLTGVHDGAGKPHELLLCGGRVLATRAQARGHPLAAGAQRHELAGWAVLAAAADPHAHLDKAFLGEGREFLPGGDVRDAARVMARVHSHITAEEITARARRAVQVALRHGFTAVRSHVDVGGGVGTRAMVALTGLRRELEDFFDLQLAALPVQPVSGPHGADGRKYLEEALAAGADVVGGCPWLDAEPLEAVDVLTAVAADAGVPIDLHIDESTEADVLTLERFAFRVEKLGLGGRATASHCVSLGQQPLGRARALARQLYQAGIAVVVLPQTNLYLQGRQFLTAVPRGLPPIAVLEEAGVVVSVGGDNWRDPFNPLGRADPMESAALVVAAGHVGIQEAYRMVSEAARVCMGLEPARGEPGDKADLLAIRASGTAEAVAGASEERIVIHSGRVVARTEVSVHGVLWD